MSSPILKKNERTKKENWLQNSSKGVGQNITIITNITNSNSFFRSRKLSILNENFNKQIKNERSKKKTVDIFNVIKKEFI